MPDMQLVEYNNQRVVTTQQIADAYETEEKYISYNFNSNKQHYILGKHYYALEGKDKILFISANRLEIPDGSKNAKVFYLWTEKRVGIYIAYA